MQRSTLNHSSNCRPARLPISIDIISFAPFPRLKWKKRLTLLTVIIPRTLLLSSLESLPPRPSHMPSMYACWLVESRKHDLQLYSGRQLSLTQIQTRHGRDCSHWSRPDKTRPPLCSIACRYPCVGLRRVGSHMQIQQFWLKKTREQPISGTAIQSQHGTQQTDYGKQRGRQREDPRAILLLAGPSAWASS